MGLRKPNRLSEHIRTGFSTRTRRESVSRDQDPQLGEAGRKAGKSTYARDKMFWWRKGLCVQIRSTTKWALPRQPCSQYPKGEPEPRLVTTSASEAASVLVSCHLRDLKQI